MLSEIKKSKVMKTFKNLITVLLLAVLAMCCTNDGVAGTCIVSPPVNEKSIVILYENDVHCNIDGYTKIAGLRDAIAAADTAYVAVACCGDFLSGGTVGAISRGGYVADIMKHVGYDAVTLGNHEFDFGIPRQKELMTAIQAPVVCANLYETGASESYFPAYTISQYGDKRIAFVGAVTPETMIGCKFAFYDNDDHQIYDLRQAEFYSLIQQAADNARRDGADYVVLLSHVGEQTQSMGFDSHQMIAATRGIDVVLDGHSHSNIAHDEVVNKDGQQTGITQAGTKFANIGKLVIKDGHFTTTLIAIEDIPYKSATVTAATNKVKQQMESAIGRVVCTSDFPLTVIDEQGKEVVRFQECNAGDLASDAFRAFFGAEIALVSGGALRNNVPAGNITYGDLASWLPYDNNMCLIEATGEDILRMLQRCTAKAPEADGNFPQCSGIRYTIHTQSHRVSDVMVLDGPTGQYVAIDPARTYRVAVRDYFKMGASYDTLKHCTVMKETNTLYRDAIMQYLEQQLGGIVPADYAHPQKRITIVED